MGRLLAAEGIEEGRLEAEVLLRHGLGLTRAQLYANLAMSLAPDQEEAFRELIKRRLAREPLAYITGHREFFGIDFYVDQRVLIPRTATELVVERALALARRFPSPLRVADVGTGCGAIAVSLALHLPQSHLYAIDISPEALEVARINCQRHGVASRVTLLEGDLLEPLPCQVHLVVANVPYIRDEELPYLSPEIALFEPRLALSGGEDGLRDISRLLSQVGGKLCREGAVVLEVGADQGPAVKRLVQEHLPGARVRMDMAWVEITIAKGAQRPGNLTLC